MDVKSSPSLHWRSTPCRRRVCSFSNTGCPPADKSADGAQARLKTVRPISVAETEAHDLDIRGPQLRSLRADWAGEGAEPRHIRPNKTRDLSPRMWVEEQQRIEPQRVGLLLALGG